MCVGDSSQHIQNPCIVKYLSYTILIILPLIIYIWNDFYLRNSAFPGPAKHRVGLFLVCLWYITLKPQLHLMTQFCKRQMPIEIPDLPLHL